MNRCLTLSKDECDSDNKCEYKANKCNVKSEAYKLEEINNHLHLTAETGENICNTFNYSYNRNFNRCDYNISLKSQPLLDQKAQTYQNNLTKINSQMQYNSAKDGFDTNAPIYDNTQKSDFLHIYFLETNTYRPVFVYIGEDNSNKHDYWCICLVIFFFSIIFYTFHKKYSIYFFIIANIILLILYIINAGHNWKDKLCENPDSVYFPSTTKDMMKKGDSFVECDNNIIPVSYTTSDINNICPDITNRQICEQTPYVINAYDNQPIHMNRIISQHTNVNKKDKCQWVSGNNRSYCTTRNQRSLYQFELVMLENGNTGLKNVKTNKIVPIYFTSDDKPTKYLKPVQYYIDLSLHTNIFDMDHYYSNIIYDNTTFYEPLSNDIKEMFPNTLPSFPYRNVIYAINLILLFFIVIHYATSYQSSQIKILLFSYIMIIFYVLYIDPLKVKTTYPVYTNIDKNQTSLFLNHQVTQR